jgi:hypothetical protein
MNEVSEGKSFSSYLRNPFVLLGLGGLVYWYISRKRLIRDNPNINPSIRFLDEDKSNFIGMLQTKAKRHKVPLKLVQDVEKMEVKEIAQMILTNQQMLNTTKVPNDERHQIMNMIDYLEFELDRKM